MSMAHDAEPLPDTLRVGLGQMLVVGGEYEANLDRAAEMVVRAAAENCDLVVLPECLDVGWTFPRAGEFATPLRGATTDRYCQLAADHSIMIAAGFTERADENLHNAAVLVDSSGQIVGHHRKIRELDFALELYTAGDTLSVSPTRFGAVGMNICADNLYSSTLANAVGVLGARVLVSPSAWAVTADRDLTTDPYVGWITSYQEIAERTGLPTVGVSNVGVINEGEWAGLHCIGSSLVVGPNGEVLAHAPYGVDAVAMVAVDVPLRSVDWRDRDW
jgi:predicted amidohydrolase